MRTRRGELNKTEKNLVKGCYSKISYFSTNDNFEIRKKEVQQKVRGANTVNLYSRAEKSKKSNKDAEALEFAL